MLLTLAKLMLLNVSPVVLVFVFVLLALEIIIVNYIKRPK